jgi:hypothetical protein
MLIAAVFMGFGEPQRNSPENPIDERSPRSEDKVRDKTLLEGIIHMAVKGAVEKELQRMGITTENERELLSLIDRHFERPSPPKTHYVVYFMKPAKKAGAEEAQVLRGDDGSSLRYVRVNAEIRAPLAFITQINGEGRNTKIVERAFLYDRAKGWQLIPTGKEPVAVPPNPQKSKPLPR